jgi:hypothetical protein
MDRITPAFRLGLDISDPPSFVPVLLLGFGQPEFLTIGGRTRIVFQDSVAGNALYLEPFLGIHLGENWNIFAGVGGDALGGNILGYDDDDSPFSAPMIQFGLGYKIK